MVPARNRYYDCYGGYFSDTMVLRSPEFMGCFANGEERQEDEEEEAGTSFRDPGDQCREGWLRLGVGIRPQESSGSPASGSSEPPLSTELELFATRPAVAVPQPPAFVPWGFWNVGAPAFLPPVRSFVVPFESSPATAGELRLVNAPARPQAGVWFLLKAAQYQGREPFLPQIPKSYLRIRDGRMSIRLLKKYLVKKLDLEDESEVDISCRGQPLLPFLTLQHIRDHIWQLREASTSLTLLPLSPCNEDHLMTLHYARSS